MAHSQLITVLIWYGTGFGTEVNLLWHRSEPFMAHSQLITVLIWYGTGFGTEVNLLWYRSEPFMVQK
jgi:hypothetical protein